MSTIATQETPVERTKSSTLRLGTGLMTLGAAAFVGYAVIFFVRNFTDSFLELGIGRGQVSVGKGQRHLQLYGVALTSGAGICWPWNKIAAT